MHRLDIRAGCVPRLAHRCRSRKLLRSNSGSTRRANSMHPGLSHRRRCRSIPARKPTPEGAGSSGGASAEGVPGGGSVDTPPADGAGSGRWVGSAPSSPGLPRQLPDAPGCIFIHTMPATDPRQQRRPEQDQRKPTGAQSTCGTCQPRRGRMVWCIVVVDHGARRRWQAVDARQIAPPFAARSFHPR